VVSAEAAISALSTKIVDDREAFSKTIDDEVAKIMADVTVTVTSATEPMVLSLLCDAQRDCNAHGTTTDTDSTDGCKCVCDSGYSGESCTEEAITITSATTTENPPPESRSNIGFIVGATLCALAFVGLLIGACCYVARLRTEEAISLPGEPVSSLPASISPTQSTHATLRQLALPEPGAGKDPESEPEASTAPPDEPQPSLGELPESEAAAPLENMFGGAAPAGQRLPELAVAARPAVVELEGEEAAKCCACGPPERRGREGNCFFSFSSI
jgi:hypothetical protein